MGTEVIPKLTFEQFRGLPSDGNRYELVYGEVHVTPAPATRHQLTLQNLLEKRKWGHSGSPSALWLKPSIGTGREHAEWSLREGKIPPQVLRRQAQSNGHAYLGSGGT